jgi:hypothetical protein
MERGDRQKVFWSMVNGHWPLGRGQWAKLGALCFVLCVAALACRRSDLRSAVLSVPGMEDERAVRIVTNAVLDEAVGRYDGMTHAYEVDVGRGVVLYHESGRLTQPEYQRRIVECIQEVGYEARVLTVALNPPAPVPTRKGPFQMWPGRYTAVLHVPGLKTRRDANVVVNAISYARLGGDSPRIAVDRAGKAIRVTYEGLLVSPRSLETAVACAGFAANGTPALLGAPDALAHGWEPFAVPTENKGI